MLFDAEVAATQGAQLAKMMRWYTPAEVLQDGDRRQRRAAGAVRAAQPLSRASSASSQEGALADLLLVDGDPIANIELVEDPDRNFLVIMKDGRVYKNTLR